MYRRRSSARRYTRRLKTVKYSNETRSVSGEWEITQGSQGLALNIIPAIDQQGVRKCKNFELSMVSEPWDGEDTAPLYWALVYVPQGTTPSPMNIGAESTTASLYEPNQNVIMTGIWPGNLTSMYRVKTRLARNLNAGDSIALLLRSAVDMPNGKKKQYAISCNYAISF